MHDEQTGEIVEAHAQRQRAGLDDALPQSQGRHRHVGIVDVPLFGPRLDAGARIECMRDLEIVDVDVHRMLVVIVVDERPLFDRTEPRLEQRNVGKCRAVEGIDEGLGIVLAGEIVEEGAGDGELALEVGSDLGDVLERALGAELLPLGELGRDALTAVGRGPRQDLRRGDEETVGVADRRRQHAQIAERGRRIVGAVIGVEDAGRAHASWRRRRATASRGSGHRSRAW